MNCTCPLVAELRAENARLRARIAELESPPLALLLGTCMGETFSGADVMAEAARQAAEAENEGRAMPDLPRLLQEAGIRNARQLAPFLRANGFVVIGKEDNCGIWARGIP